MDTSSLLNLLQLIEADERDFTIMNRIEQLRALVANNNPSEGPQITERINELLAVLGASRASLFSRTEIDVMESLGADHYFGQGLITSLQGIMSSAPYELNSQLTEFARLYTEKYNTLMRLASALVDNAVKPYAQKQDELAFTLPNDEIPPAELSKRMGELSTFLRVIQECANPTATTHEAPEIVRVSKGTYDFFLNIDPDTLKSVVSLIADLATIYVAKKQLWDAGQPTVLTEAEKEELNQLVERSAKKRVDEFLERNTNKLAGNDNHELRARVSTSLKLLLKWLAIGVHVEIVYQKTVEPIDQTSKEGKEIAKKATKQLAINQVYNLPLEQLRLPKPEGEEDQTDNDESPEEALETNTENNIEAEAPSEATTEPEDTTADDEVA